MDDPAKNCSRKCALTNPTPSTPTPCFWCLLTHCHLFFIHSLFCPLLIPYGYFIYQWWWTGACNTLCYTRVKETMVEVFARNRPLSAQISARYYLSSFIPSTPNFPSTPLISVLPTLAFVSPRRNTLLTFSNFFSK